MKIPNFLGKVSNKGEYVCSNYIPITALPLSVGVQKDKITGELTVKLKSEKLSFVPIKAYYVLNRVFVFANDRNVYELTNGGYTFISGNFESSPEILPVVYKNFPAVAIINKSTLIIAGKNLVVCKIRKSKNHAFFKDRLFSSENEKIYFSASNLDAELSGVASDYSHEGELDAGDRVISLIPYKNYLLVVCAHSLKKLTPNYETDSFEFTDLGVKLGGVKENTVLNFENETLFVCGNSLLTFSNDVDTVGKYLSENNYEVCGEAVRVKDYYFLPVKTGEEKYFYVYKPVDRKEFFIPAKDYIPCGNGQLFDCKTKDVAELGKDGECEWISIKTDFGVTGKKILSKICFYSEKSGVITVVGDDKTVKREFGVGENRINLCLTSKTFELRIKAIAADFKVKNLKAEFRY